MKILKKVMLVLGVLLALILVVSLFLPQTFEVKRSRSIAAPPDSVFLLVADLKNWKQWSPWQAKDPQMELNLSDNTFGPGSTLEWKSKTEGNGKVTYKTVMPASLAVYTLHISDWGMESEGKFALEPDGDKTKLTWTMTGDVGMNPFSKFGILFMDKWVGADFDAGLENLDKAVGKK